MARIWAWRAAIRLARRDAWRNKGRSALIAVMVALPVLLTSAVSVLYRSDEADLRDTVQVALGDQAQASIGMTMGTPVTQSPDGQNSGSSGSDEPTKVLSAQDLQGKATAIVADRDRVVLDRRLSSDSAVRIHDRLVAAVTVREFDYTAPGTGGIVTQVSGRAPETAGEVVVSENLARKQKIDTGGRLSLTYSRDQAAKVFTVVGVVRGPSLIGNPSVIGPSGSFFPADVPPSNSFVGGGYLDQTLLVVGPDPVTWDQVLDLNQLGATVLSRGVIADPPPPDRVPFREGDYGDSGQTEAIGIVVVVIGLVLLQIALLAGPAIAVGARRNQRGLAVIASAGAERRHLRSIVLATNGVIGLVSCLVAAGLGAGLGAIVVRVARDRYDQAFVRVDIRLLDLLGLALVGALTTVAAALLPARQAARMDVVAALTGRRGQAPPRLRVPVTGLLVAAVGAVLAYWASDRNQPFAAVGGLALTEIGLVAAAGALVALTARLAVRLPFAPRFALRDAARQRGRTAPAVAAVMAAIAGGTAALTYISAQALHDQQTYTPSAALGVAVVQGEQMDADTLAAAQAALRRTLPVGRAVTFYGIRQANDGTDAYLLPTRSPRNECPMNQEVPLDQEQVTRLLRTDPRCRESYARGPRSLAFSGDALFDDGTALPVLTGTDEPADSAALRAGQVLVSDPLLLWPDGTVHIEVDRESATGTGENTTAAVVLPARLSTRALLLSSPVYPRSAAKALGVDVQPAGFFATTTRLPTSAEEEAASAAVRDAADSYLTLERGYHDSYSLVLLGLVVAAGIITLGGTFTAVGLAAAEGRADVATLAAVGAGPGVRRRLAASQAGVIAGLGSVLGVAGGVLAGWILVRMQRTPLSGDYVDVGTGAHWQLDLPWTYLLATAFGVPLLAVAVGYLTTRSRLPLVRRLGQ